MNWGYPSEDADPWLEDFLAFVRGTDASAYAAREDRNMLLMGGGLISWDATSGALTWAAEIELLSPNTGFLNRVPAGSVTIADGQVVFGSVARALGGNASLTVSTGSFAPSTDNAIVLCIRRGSSIYWRTGLIMGDGDTITNIGSSQSGSGTVVLVGDASGPASATVVEKLRGFLIDPAFSPSVNHGIRWDGSKFVSFLLPTSVGGDVTGVFASTTVTKLRGGLIDPAISPSSGDVIQWDGGKYVAASLPTGSASNFVVFRPGGVAGGIVYDDWAAFYAAATAIVGPIHAFIDDRSAPAEVPSGTYDFHRWRFYGAVPGRRTTLKFMDLANWTIAPGASPIFAFSLTDMRFELDSLSSTSAISSPASVSGQLYIEMRNSAIVGPFGGAVSFIDAKGNGGGTQFTVVVHAYGPSELGDYAIRIDADDPGSGSTADLYLYDTASVAAMAVTGPSGTVTQRQQNRAATIQAQTGVVAGQAYYFGQATPQNWSLDKTQLGTTELHIGSVWIPASSILRTASRAMLGGSTVSEVGILKMRRFTGGTLVATWTASAGTIQDVQLSGNDIVIADSDWYDLYLVAGGAGDTAVIKGLRLFVHEPGNVS